MNIYNDYIGRIKPIINPDSRISGTRNTFDGSIRSYRNGLSIEEPLPSLNDFAHFLGRRPNYNQKLGEHPDFKDLKQYPTQTENHYIVSMFIDIKNSTNLFKRYSNQEVYVITQTIQLAAIHTCLIFGGYIHRLQGDGLFVYFGGKNIDEKQAVADALMASSVFTYFVKNDLKNLFDEQGIETIFTRTGIDFGGQETLWAVAGWSEISEVTTCSLHTSLASKMQSIAMSNGIVVGDNIIRQINGDYFEPVSKRKKDEKFRYVFRNQEENFYYTQYDFAWEGFLRQSQLFPIDQNGNIHLVMKNKTVLNAASLRPIAIKNKPALG